MKQSISKARSDSKLDALPREQREQLIEWLAAENLGYVKVVERVRERFGTMTSIRAVHAFYMRHVLPGKFAEATCGADAVAGEVDESIEAAAMRCAKQLAFGALANPEPDVKVAQGMFRLVREMEKVSLSRERVAVTKEHAAITKERVALEGRRVAVIEATLAALRARAAAAEKRAKEVEAKLAEREKGHEDEKLTPEEREAKLREIFGLP